MSIDDKRSVLRNLAGRPHVEFELGCGSQKKIAEAIGIDAIDSPCVDLVGDVFEVLGAIPSRCAGAVHAFHFMEHIADVPALLHEVARILKPGARLNIVVPHFSNPYYYSDLTHKTFFGLYTFSYLACEHLFRRKVPNYGQRPEFDLVAVNLVFKSPRPFYGRYAFKRVLGLIFNLNRWTREFYEENLCYLFPCYEIHYELRTRTEDAVPHMAAPAPLPR
ncbi:MAG: methyltransferase domain-containing protein [bacterium]